MTAPATLPATLKGPGLFLAQFAGDAAPFDTLDGICRWAAGLGYKGVQIPTWDRRLFDLARAAESQTYCDEVVGTAAAHGLALTELSTHLQGQLVAVNPAYDAAFDAFAPEAVRGRSRRAPGLGGRPGEAGGARVAPARARGQRVLHGGAAVALRLSLAAAPGRARRDGLRRTRAPLAPHPRRLRRERLRPRVRAPSGRGRVRRRHVRAVPRRGGRAPALAINYDPSHFLLQGLDYLSFIDIYHERIRAFHAKDAEFNPTGRQGFYSGFRPWLDRAARFRSLGDGQVDFGGVFSKLAQHGYASWAVLEWECCLKHPEDGAREGAALHRRPHHPGDGARLRRLRRLGARRGAQPPHAGPNGRPGKRAMTASCWIPAARADHDSQARRPAHPARHGGRRRGRLHRRGAPHRGTARRPLRARGRRAVVDAREGGPLRRGARPRSAPTPTSPAWRAEEAARPDGIEAVSIVTPNHLHAAAAHAFLDAGVHVVCDKPMTTTLAEARALADHARRSGLVFALTHNYTGYPMVRQARDMVRAGNSALSGSCRSNMPRTGSPRPSRTPATSRRAGGPTPPGRRRRLHRRHRHPRLQPRRLRDRPRRRTRGQRGADDLRDRVGGSTTTCGRCCATRAGRAGALVGQPGRGGRGERGAPARLRHGGRARLVPARREPAQPTRRSAASARSSPATAPGPPIANRRASRVPAGHPEGYLGRLRQHLRRRRRRHPGGEGWRRPGLPSLSVRRGRRGRPRVHRRGRALIERGRGVDAAADVSMTGTPRPMAGGR